jgi:hypothetical protein
MRKDHRTALFFLSVVLVMTTLGGTRTSAQAVTEQTPPPRPSWIDADRKMKPEMAPREVPAVGPDGKLIKDAKGSDKTVSTHIGEVPPPPLR